MYDFVRIQYQLGKLTDEQVRAFAPRWLTVEQAEDVINGEG